MATQITRDELKLMLDRGDRFVLAEALPPEYFAQGRLPTAVNLPLDRLSDLGPALAADRSTLVVVYCSGPTCNNSHIAAQRLTAMGYDDVRVYAGGKQEWTEAGLTIEGAPVLR